MADSDQIPTRLWPWLAGAAVTLAGWAIGWLARPAANTSRRVVRRVIHIEAGADVDPEAVLDLRRAVGRALVQHRPEADLAFEAQTSPDLRIGIRAEADTLRLTPIGIGEEIAPSELTVSSATPGEVIAAWLLMHFEGDEVARAACELLTAIENPDVCATSLGLLAQDHLLPRDGDERDSLHHGLRNILGDWPSAWPPIDRLLIERRLAGSLIRATPTPAAAARFYEALERATRVLTGHWSGGRTTEAAASYRQIAEVRLALGRAEQESSHLTAAREAIEHALAHASRSTSASLRSADLALVAEIEHQHSQHEPGTASLIRAVRAAREALTAPPEDSPERTSRLVLLADCLSELAAREASPGRTSEAVATAREAMLIGPSATTKLTLARALALQGEIEHRIEPLEESLRLTVGEAGRAARIVEAQALEMLGTARSDATQLRAAAQIWRAIADETYGIADPDLSCRRCRCALQAARLSSDAGLLAEAIDLARSLVRQSPRAAVQSALDHVTLGDALLARAYATRAGTADAQGAADSYAEALMLLRREPLPALRSELAHSRAKALRLVALDLEHIPTKWTPVGRQKVLKANNLDRLSDPQGSENGLGGPAESEAATPQTAAAAETSTLAQDLELSLAAIARRLDPQSEVALPQQLADARRQVLALIDRSAAEGSYPGTALGWLDRIERAQERS